MRARITHTLSYRYSAPVLLGDHRFCLQPRGHGFQRLLSFACRITPEPDHLYALVAASGDEILRARFLGSTDTFLVQAVLEDGSRISARGIASAGALDRIPQRGEPVILHFDAGDAVLVPEEGPG